MNTFVIILVVLVLVVVVALVFVGLVLLKMLDDARRAKSLWAQYEKVITQLTVHFPVPPNVITRHQRHLLEVACSLADVTGGPGKTVPLMVVVNGNSAKQLEVAKNYENYARRKNLTGATIVTEFIMPAGNVEEEVNGTLKFVDQVSKKLALSHSDSFPTPVHGIVCSSPRVAFLRAVWVRTYGTPVTGFCAVNGAPLRMWMTEMRRLSLYYVARCFGKLRRLMICTIDNQAVK